MNTFTASAPGRVNLIGEHTDYNNGFVLPTPIPLSTIARLEPRQDRAVTIRTERASRQTDVLTYDLDSETAAGSWGDYVKAITWVLRESGFAIAGFELSLRSEIPEGSGLSSSAALEVSVMRAIREAFALSLDDVSLALLCRRAEVEFVGAKVGIMDQMAASVGQPNTALFLDTQEMNWRLIPLPRQLHLIVIHSGISHQHNTGSYNERWAECREACRILGIPSLREITLSEFQKRRHRLSMTLAKRVQHVITENARVLAAVRAVEQSDLRTLGGLFRESHASMRDDYQVSLPEIDLLVDLANRSEQVYGARLTGGGFGGSVVIAAKPDPNELAARLVSRYNEMTNCNGMALVA